LFVALAPVATTAHLENEAMRIAASQVDFLQWLIVDVLNYPNLIPPSYLEDEALEILCDVFPCKELIKILYDDDIDNGDRLDTGISIVPSG